MFSRTALTCLIGAVSFISCARGGHDVPSARLSPIPKSYWGMHVHNASATWPSVEFGTWRLWDANVAWPQLEPRKGEWHFDVLDQYVALAQLHQVRILLVLGLSPQWASARPTEHSVYHPGNSAPPADLNDWRIYVRTVASRYKGRIREYELWNEPNLKDFYTGTVSEMVALTREASNVIKSVDPSSTVASPSATTTKGVGWLKEFLRDGGGRYVDVIGYHFYVSPESPEAMLPLIQKVKRVVQTYGHDKPIWNTESGWGTAGPDRKTSMITDLAAAYVARSYILNWLAGVQRFYWYAWDNHWWVTLEMTNENGTRTTAVNGFERVRSWMLGRQLVGCEIQSGTWICYLQQAGKPEWIVWNPERRAVYYPQQAVNATNLQGYSWPVSAPLEVGPNPLLLQ